MGSIYIAGVFMKRSAHDQNKRVAQSWGKPPYLLTLYGWFDWMNIIV